MPDLLTMTHAAKSHDAIDRLIDMRERLDALIAHETIREEKLREETAKLEAALAIANAQRILSKLLRQSTVTDGDRMQIKGVKEQLARVA
jgi:dsDNA-binding SOS-regulon protein